MKDKKPKTTSSPTAPMVRILRSLNPHAISSKGRKEFVQRCMTRALQRAGMSVLKKYGNSIKVATDGIARDELKRAYLRIAEHAERLGWIAPDYKYTVEAKE